MTVLAEAGTPAPRPRVRGLTAERVFLARSLRHSLRDGETLVMSIALPVMLMLLFTFVFGNAIDPTGGYVDYVVPGIILLCAGFGAATTAVYVARDLSTGIVDRLRTMPLRAGAVLSGHVAASLVRNLIATGVVIAVAIAVGFRPTAGVGDWIAALVVVAVYILAITYLFATIGLAAGSPEAASGYGFVILFLPYLSSAFVPVETMPSWLQWFAAHQPVTPVTETIRGLLLGAPLGTQPVWAVGWCVLITAVAAAWGAWLFPRAGRRH